MGYPKFIKTKKKGSILLNYRLGSPVNSGVTRRQSCVYFVRGFSPQYFVPEYKKVPIFYKIADMRRSSKSPHPPRNT